MQLIGWLAVAGLVVTIFAHGCAQSHAERPEDARIGKVNIAVLGGFGYLAIALFGFLAAGFKVQGLAGLTHALVIAGFLLTLYLIWRAWRIKFGCPVCVINWAINLVLLIASCKMLAN